MSQPNLEKMLPPEPDLTSESPLPPTPNLPAPEALSGHILATASSVENAYAASEKPITPAQLSSLLWLVSLAKQERLNMSSLSRLCHIDATTLGRIFSAKYNVGLDSITERIAKFRELYEQRQNLAAGKFVETSVSRNVWQFCDTARLYNTPVFIYGDPQVGKTWALEEYARRNNHGSTIYVRMPSGGNLSEFLCELNGAIGENTRCSNSYLRTKPIVRLGDGKVLIIDEIHQCVITTGRGSGGIRVKTVEYIRELWDRTGCGLVLCGTNVFRDEVERGRNKLILEQLSRRSMATLQLPPILPRMDMDQIAAAYGFPPADDAAHELRTQIVRTKGLRAYVNHLRGAGFGASKRGAKVTWRHFVSAHDALAKLSTGAGK